MRMKRSRVKQYYHKKAETIKDGEGGTSVEYQPSVLFKGEVWPAGGKIQAQQYGDKLSYIQNLRIQGDYTVKQDEKGILHYVFSKDLDIVEGDGLCLYVDKDSEPDYRIISIKPYKPLRLEVEKLV